MFTILVSYKSNRCVNYYRACRLDHTYSSASRRRQQPQQIISEVSSQDSSPIYFCGNLTPNSSALSSGYNTPVRLSPKFTDCNFSPLALGALHNISGILPTGITPLLTSPSDVGNSTVTAPAVSATSGVEGDMNVSLSSPLNPVRSQAKRKPSLSFSMDSILGITDDDQGNDDTVSEKQEQGEEKLVGDSDRNTSKQEASDKGNEESDKQGGGDDKVIPECVENKHQCGETNEEEIGEKPKRNELGDVQKDNDETVKVFQKEDKVEEHQVTEKIEMDVTEEDEKSVLDSIVDKVVSLSFLKGKEVESDDKDISEVISTDTIKKQERSESNDVVMTEDQRVVKLEVQKQELDQTVLTKDTDVEMKQDNRESEITGSQESDTGNKSDSHLKTEMGEERGGYGKVEQMECDTSPVVKQSGESPVKSAIIEHVEEKSQHGDENKSSVEQSGTEPFKSPDVEFKTKDERLENIPVDSSTIENSTSEAVSIQVTATSTDILSQTMVDGSSSTTKLSTDDVQKPMSEVHPSTKPVIIACSTEVETPQAHSSPLKTLSTSVSYSSPEVIVPVLATTGEQDQSLPLQTDTPVQDTSTPPNSQSSSTVTVTPQLSTTQTITSSDNMTPQLSTTETLTSDDNSQSPPQSHIAALPETNLTLTEEDPLPPPASTMKSKVSSEISETGNSLPFSTSSMKLDVSHDISVADIPLPPSTSPMKCSESSDIQAADISLPSLTSSVKPSTSNDNPVSATPSVKASILSSDSVVADIPLPTLPSPVKSNTSNNDALTSNSGVQIPSTTSQSNVKPSLSEDKDAPSPCPLPPDVPVATDISNAPPRLKSPDVLTADTAMPQLEKEMPVLEMETVPKLASKEKDTGSDVEKNLEKIPGNEVGMAGDRDHGKEGTEDIKEDVDGKEEKMEEEESELKSPGIIMLPS